MQSFIMLSCRLLIFFARSASSSSSLPTRYRRVACSVLIYIFKLVFGVTSFKPQQNNNGTPNRTPPIECPKTKRIKFNIRHSLRPGRQRYYDGVLARCNGFSNYAPEDSGVSSTAQVYNVSIKYAPVPF